MSEGIRIRPRAELGFPDGALVVVTDHARPFPPPADGTPLEVVQPVCHLCGIQHFAKVYHLQLRAGSVIVSAEVWANLRGLAENPFELMNVVAEPPAQGLYPNTDRPAELIEKYAMPILTTRSN